jgi:hypothetical protein
VPISENERGGVSGVRLTRRYCGPFYDDRPSNRYWIPVASFLLLAPALASCWPSNGNSELGLLATLTVVAPATSPPGGVPIRGAQFFPGKMPKATTATDVPEIDSPNNIIYPGELNRVFTGRVGVGAQVVAIGLVGDVGYWVVPVETPDEQYPGQADFSATGQFSTALPIGDQTIQFQAGDGQGHFGPPNPEVLTSVDVGAPQGYLIVHLQWDTESDLDLHVETPDGTVLWAKAQTTFTMPPPGAPPATQAEVKEAGILQFDSNGNCVIDGKRQENAYWNVTPSKVPVGTYTVRVDAYSMCSQAYGAWKVWVETRTDPTKTGTTIATASGTLNPRDTQFPHTALSGTFALTFNISPTEYPDAGP